VIGYLDCSSGVSGDKFLGALLDLGAVRGDFTAEDLRDIVATLAGEARVDVERVLSRGVSAIGVTVHAEGEPHSRSWADIERLLEAANLPEPVRAAAIRTFDALAVAEATVHGVAVDDVHFHEVGALDSIADIVGVCAGLHALGVETVFASPVAVGSGTVETSHGTLPVPAPATAALLADLAIVAGPASGELTTPTGAALVKTLCAGVGVMPPMLVDRVGYGAGTRDIGSPNVCRLIVGEGRPGLGTPSLPIEPVVLLETNIDHLTPEELAFAAEELLATPGALDVWQTPIVMKKGRSAVALSVLAETGGAEFVAERVIELTGSLGVRRSPLERYVAPREIVSLETPWGPVRLKVGAGRARPEHEDVAEIARRTGRPYAEVANEIALLHGFEDEE
jgi:uncharacterized protein (TIGR00299 family) protein